MISIILSVGKRSYESCKEDSGIKTQERAILNFQSILKFPILMKQYGKITF